MTKQTLLKYMWVMIFMANIWGGCWFLHEKCTGETWWTLPSLVTFSVIGAVASWKIYRIYYYD